MCALGALRRHGSRWQTRPCRQLHGHEEGRVNVDADRPLNTLLENLVSCGKLFLHRCFAVVHGLRTQSGSGHLERRKWLNAKERARYMIHDTCMDERWSSDPHFLCIRQVEQANTHKRTSLYASAALIDLGIILMGLATRREAIRLLRLVEVGGGDGPCLQAHERFVFYWYQAQSRLDS